MNEDGKRISIYRTGFSGKFAAYNLSTEGLNLYGFCNSKRAKSFSEGLMVKPVVDLNNLLNKEDSYAIFAKGAAPQVLEKMKTKGSQGITYCFTLIICRKYKLTNICYFQSSILQIQRLLIAAASNYELQKRNLLVLSFLAAQ